MTWKPCAGCTRAIAATAFTCEYCGQVCDDVLDLAPIDADRAGSLRRNDSGPITAGRAPDMASGTAGVPSGPVTTSDWSFATNHAARTASTDSVAGGRELFTRDALDFLDAERTHHENRERHWEAGGESSIAPSQSASGADDEQPGPGARVGTRQLAVVGGGALAAGALMFTMFGLQGAASPDSAAATAAARRTPVTAPARPNATTPAAVKSATPAADAPRWNRAGHGRWVGTSRQAAAFELQATGRVRVWTRDVTPVLVVRCAKGTTEAFVYTQSAARMEPQDGDHTVQVAFDGGSPAMERWPDSAEHDALFARDAAAFMRRLSESRTLHFTFTPHNAEQAVATFVLDGLAPLLASARECGWKS